MKIEVLIKSTNGENYCKTEFTGTIDEAAVWITEIIKAVKITMFEKSPKGQNDNGQ